MMSNGNNMMQDYLNEMQKYLTTSQKANMNKYEQSDNSNTERRTNIDNSKLIIEGEYSKMSANNFQLDDNILMNKDKLYETFLMFMNSQQLAKPNNFGGKSKEINELQDSDQIQNNFRNQSLEISPTEIYKSVDRHTNSIKTFMEPMEKKENKIGINNYKNNSLIMNNQILTKENENLTNSVDEFRVSNTLDNDNQNIDNNNNIIQNTFNNEEGHPNTDIKEVKSFDDIPIKPKTTNFLELLEQNLAKEGLAVDNNYENQDSINAERIRRIRESKSKLKKNNLNLQAPSEPKKYKYYLQNFNKSFGKDEKVDENHQEIPPLDPKPAPAKSKFDDRKNPKKKTKTIPKKNSIKQEKITEKDKNSKNNNSNQTKTNSYSTYSTINNETSKNNYASGKKDSGNIWSEKPIDIKKVDDFLNNSMKPNMPQQKRNSIKDEKLDTSISTNKEDYEIKMLNAPSNIRLNSTVTKQTSSTTTNKTTRKTEEVSRKASSNIDANNLKQYYTNTLNEVDVLKNKTYIDINIEDNYKTNALRSDNLNLDNLDLNDYKEKNHGISKQTQNEQINARYDIKEIYRNNIKGNAKIEDTNEKEDILQEDLPQEENQVHYDVDDDGEDDRDIIRMYEQKVQKNSNKNILQEENIHDSDFKEEISLFKKPEQQSKLINKYFKPLIKEPNKTNSENINTDKKKDFANISQLNQSQNNYQEIINEKIEELNKEIDKLKKENEKVTKLKTEYERLTKKLNREMEEYYTKRQKEIEDFELWKEEETKKMEKERKVHLRNTKLLQNMPNRKEREEIDLLKEQVLKQQEEMKAKENRNKLANERTKKQLEDALKKNEELQKEIKFMEELRVRNMLNRTSGAGNRTRAPSKAINIDNAANNQLGNTINNKVNSQMVNNRSTNNLVSPPKRLVQPTKEKSNVKFNQTQQQHPNKANMNNYSIKPNITDFKQNLNISSSEENMHEEEEIFENSIKEDSLCSNDENINDYYNPKTKSNTEEEKKIQMNKVKVTKTPNVLNIQSKTELIQETRRQTEENTKKGISKNLVPIDYKLKNESNQDNSRQKEKTSVSPPKKDKKHIKTNNTNKNVLLETSDKSKDNFEMVFPDKYHGKAAQNVRLTKQEITEDGKIIKLYENMKKVVRFPSGVVKEIFEDGYQVTYFINNDIKQVYPDKKEVYLFAENKTLQFKFADGLHVFKFEGGLLEKHYPDGTKVVNYIDGRIRNVYPDGYEETFFPDGSLQKIDKNGIVTFDYEDGLKVKY
jgi:centromere protein J